MFFRDGLQGLPVFPATIGCRQVQDVLVLLKGLRVGVWDDS